MKKHSFIRQILLYVVLFVLIIVMMSSLFYKDTKSTEIANYTELGNYIREDEVKEIFVHNNNVVSVTL